MALTGRFDATTAEKVEKRLNALIDQKVKLVIDMQGVDYISSAGIRALQMALKSTKLEGGEELMLVALQPEVLNFLK
ncbi:STAS domain-containing protein [candidate division KSB1 bacterium]|nr:STAS domain-containing protein [candidate division KSB1 bacterium]